MSRPYTLGNWVAKPGREEEFVSAWRELATWTTREIGGNPSAKLLRDVTDSRRFVSIGPWDSLEAIDAWRALPEFRERVSALREFLESFEPLTLELLAEVG
jgi:heme-degrading monooxygenase HmoA